MDESLEAYYAERVAAIAAQRVDPGLVEALDASRAEAIRAQVVDVGGVDAARVSLLETTAVEEPGDRWVPCQLELGAGD